MKIIEKIKSKAIKILKRHGVHRASIFGSFARGTSTQKSDIDFLIEFSGKKSLLDLVGLKFDLEKTLKRKVDVVTYKSIHPLLRDRILREQTPII